MYIPLWIEQTRLFKITKACNKMPFSNNPTTLSISLAMHQTGYSSLYIFKYVSNQEITLSISVAMHQTGYNSLYIFKYVSNPDTTLSISLKSRYNSLKRCILYLLPRVIQLTAMKQISYSTDLIRYNWTAGQTGKSTNI